MNASPNDALGANSAYYESMPVGLDDYWNRMAAPRFRTDILCKLVLDADPTSVAELGCGNGRLLMELSARGYAGRRLGIDLSENRISQNRTQMPAIEWLAANLEERSVFPSSAERTFEAVIACELIEHLSQPETMLANARALAQPGRGMLYLSTQSGEVGATERLVGHQRHFTKKNVEEMLQRTGWQPIRVWNTGFPFHDLSKRIANLRPSATMNRFSNRQYGGVENLICWVLRMLFRLNSHTRGAQLFAVARAGNELAATP